MSCNVLVAYATRFGSTAGIADVIAEELRAAGLSVTIAAADDAPPASRFDAVVLGSAIYNARWMDEALDYLKQHADALNRIPTAYYQVGLSIVGGSDIKQRIAEGWLEPASKVAPPVAAVTFPGALDRSKLSGGQRLMVWMSRVEDGDYRDWDAIRGWARELARVFMEQPVCTS
jgi:menaquinone-dependent protoporphyrinogen oxidase